MAWQYCILGLGDTYRELFPSQGGGLQPREARSAVILAFRRPIP